MVSEEIGGGSECEGRGDGARNATSRGSTVRGGGSYYRLGEEVREHTFSCVYMCMCMCVCA